MRKSTQACPSIVIIGGIVTLSSSQFAFQSYTCCCPVNGLVDAPTTFWETGSSDFGAGEEGIVTIVRPLKVAMSLSHYLWRTFLKFLHGSKGRANRDVARCLHASADLLIHQGRVRISRVDEYVRPALAAC